MNRNGKPKLAIYWAAACGGCDVAILNIGENILVVDDVFDIVFWPIATDYKYDHLRGYQDQSVDVCLFSGAIRNSENEELAHLLRQKSRVLVAFGACAQQGSIPALSNLTSKKATLNTVYIQNDSTHNPEQVIPQTSTPITEGQLTLPDFYHTVKALDQVVEVDYTIPGCPPEPEQIWKVLQVVVSALTEGTELPPHGSILGAGNVAVCDECPLEKQDKSIHHFYRPHEIIPEPNKCLFEQGLVCMGISTRGGCGALCPQVGMGCRACYGPLDSTIDQGARMVAAVASVLGTDHHEHNEETIEKEVTKIVDTLVDPAGTFYRFGMSKSLLRRAKVE